MTKTFKGIETKSFLNGKTVAVKLAQQLESPSTPFPFPGSLDRFCANDLTPLLLNIKEDELKNSFCENVPVASKKDLSCCLIFHDKKNKTNQRL